MLTSCFLIYVNISHGSQRHARLFYDRISTVKKIKKNGEFIMKRKQKTDDITVKSEIRIRDGISYKYSLIRRESKNMSDIEDVV